MSREIKFRGWHEGYTKGFKNPLPAKMLYEEKIGDVLRWIGDGQPITPMQFTGMTDRLGKEVYEGDVLRDMAGDFKAEWAPGMGGWGALDADGVMMLLADCLDTAEIVGNIFEKETPYAN